MTNHVTPPPLATSLFIATLVGATACPTADDSAATPPDLAESTSSGAPEGPDESSDDRASTDRGQDGTGSSGDPTTTTSSTTGTDDTTGEESSSGGADCIDEPAGLVALWSAGAQDGTDAAGGHHASPSGVVGYTDDVAEQTDGFAFEFEGAAGYLDAGAAPELAIDQGSFTIAARVRLDAMTAPIDSPSQETEDASIVSKMGGSNSNGWRLHKQGVAGRFWFCFGEANGTNGCEDGDATLVQSATTPEVGVWHSVVGVKEGLTIRIYVDGELEGESTMSDFAPGPQEPLLLGAWAGNPGVGIDGYLPGALDDVMLFDRALAQDEIAALHEQPVCGAG